MVQNRFSVLDIQTLSKYHFYGFGGPQNGYFQQKLNINVYTITICTFSISYILSFTYKGWGRKNGHFRTASIQVSGGGEWIVH